MKMSWAMCKDKIMHYAKLNYSDEEFYDVTKEFGFANPNDQRLDVEYY